MNDFLPTPLKTMLIPEFIFELMKKHELNKEFGSIEQHGYEADTILIVTTDKPATDDFKIELKQMIDEYVPMWATPGSITYKTRTQGY